MPPDRKAAASSNHARRVNLTRSTGCGALASIDPETPSATQAAARFIEPARRFAEMAGTFATEHGVACHVGLQILPGVGHSGDAGYEAARSFLFGN